MIISAVRLLLLLRDTDGKDNSAMKMFKLRGGAHKEIWTCLLRAISVKPIKSPVRRFSLITHDTKAWTPLICV